MTDFHFVVPVKHPSNVRNASEQYTAMEELFYSFSGQSAQNFVVNIVCNHEQDLPELPSFVQRINVDFPPNETIQTASSRKAVYQSIRFDKGRRVLAGFKSVAPEDYVMICDDDDLIHRHLVQTVLDGEPETARFIRKGYSWTSGTRQMKELVPFHKICGTSLIIPARFYKFHDKRSSEEEIIQELGSHLLPFENMQSAGRSFKTIDFFAAVYRVQSANSTQVEVNRAKRTSAPPPLTLLQKVGRRTKRLLKPGGFSASENTSSVAFEAGDWLEKDFLGGHPLVQTSAPLDNKQADRG